MKKNLSLNLGLLFPGWMSCTLALLAALTFSGCATDKAKMASTDAAMVEKAHKELILLREGDTVRISFPGAANFDTTQQIRRDGRISMPLVGEVDIAGMTPDEVKNKMIDLYASQISSKEVTVTVVSSAFPIFVTGSVVHPGKITSDHPITALEAIMEAGGFEFTTANIKAVRIIRQETNTVEHFTLNMKGLIDGTDTQQFFLKPSDIIYVPERFSFF